jgi:hypothetical protein
MPFSVLRGVVMHFHNLILKKSGNSMKTLIYGCIALMLYTFDVEAKDGNSNKNWKTTVFLESKIDADGISLVLNDELIGVYHHFILEKSLDGKSFIEVARVDELKDTEGSRKINFKDFPFDKNSLSCVYYRIRAVDEFGWFDFTNTVTAMRKLDIAQKNNKEYLSGQPNNQF